MKGPIGLIFLQKHVYGQSTGTVKNGLVEVIFHLGI